MYLLSTEIILLNSFIYCFKGQRYFLAHGLNKYGQC